MSVTEAPRRLTYRDMRSNVEVVADERVKEQVLAGLDLLNERYGPDWVENIDPAVLLMESGNRCVLGQVYGDYSDGLSKLEIGDDYHNGQPYGFYAYHVDDVESAENERRWNALTDAWLVAVGAEQRYGSW